MMIEAGGKVIQVDPWSQGKYEGLPKADLILITDIHPDHMDAKEIANLKKDETTIIAPAAVTQRADSGMIDGGMIDGGIDVRLRDWYY